MQKIFKLRELLISFDLKDNSLLMNEKDFEELNRLLLSSSLQELSFVVIYGINKTQQGKLVESWLSVHGIKANFIINHNKYDEPILQLNNIYRKQHTYHEKKRKKKHLKQNFARNTFTGNLEHYKKKVHKTSKVLNHNVRKCSKQGSKSFKKNQRILKNATIIIDLSHDRFDCLHSKFLIQKISQNNNNKYFQRDLDKKIQINKVRGETYLGCPNNNSIAMLNLNNKTKFKKITKKSYSIWSGGFKKEKNNNQCSRKVMETIIEKKFEDDAFIDDRTK